MKNTKETKKFEAPVIEIIKIEQEDVIATSTNSILNLDVITGCWELPSVTDDETNN